MKYYYEKPENWVGAGEVYQCKHPVFNLCTLFRSRDKDKSVGFAIVQERFDPVKKTRRWTSVDPWLAGDIFLNPKFEAYFVEHSAPPDENGLYPTYPVRKVMWALRMKPLKKEIWEEWEDL